MPAAVLAVPLGAAIVLIVVGRFNHRAWWGNWVAIAGYGLLALTIVLRCEARS